jgi:hypothetical protein
MSVDDYADEIEVPSFAPRMVCSKCGGRSRCPAELERNALSATEASGMTDAPQHHEFAAPCGCDVELLGGFREGGFLVRRLDGSNMLFAV